MKIAGTLAWLALLSGVAQPETPGVWRYWTVFDGLAESFTEAVTRGPEGNIWARHGEIATGSVLNGYAVRSFAVPSDVGSGLWAMEGGVTWTTAGRQVVRFEQGRWHTQPIRAISDQGERPDLAPLDANRALVLLPDLLLAYDARTRKADTIRRARETCLKQFREMEISRDGVIWIVGDEGLARMTFSEDLPPAHITWDEFSLQGLDFHQLRNPSPGRTGEVLAVGTLRADGQQVALRFWQGGWQKLLSRRGGRLFVWRGTDDTMWIQDDDSLRRLDNGESQSVERQGVLAADIRAVTHDEGGTYWLATAQGLARYAPALWQTPGPVSDLKELVHSIHEDDDGRLWFAARDRLAVLDGNRWSVHPLPAGRSTDRFSTSALVPLADRRIAVSVEEESGLLVFDPETQSFLEIDHPSGTFVKRIWSRRDGTVGIQLRGTSRLETYDGQEFGHDFDLGEVARQGFAKGAWRANDGALWLGTNKGIGLCRDGQCRDFGAASGFPDTGAFSVLGIAGGRLLVGGRENLLEFDGDSWEVLEGGLDRVRSITQASDGTVWLASGTGIHRYGAEFFLTNGIEEGLPSEVAYVVHEDRLGRIWAGTNRGIALYRPDADRDPPQTWIAEEDNLREWHSSGKARLVFRGRDKWNYTRPDRLLYSWRVAGSAWTRFGPPTNALFEKLRSGEHRFEVRAMDRNGNIDPSPATFAFSVVPQWHQQPGFLAVLAAGGLLLAALATVIVTQFVRRGRLLVKLKEESDGRQSAYEALSQVRNHEHQVMASLPSLCISVRADGTVAQWNAAAEEVLAVAAADVMGQPFASLDIDWPSGELQEAMTRCQATGQPVRLDEIRLRGLDHGERILTLTVARLAAGPDQSGGVVVIGSDITEQSHMESQLALAQKMESLGQLAAGIAHEINTPTQYVSDNTRFLVDAFDDLRRIIDHHGKLRSAAAEGPVPATMLAALAETVEEADLEFLEAEVPKALSQSLEGLERVSGIVRAMKEFSHPDHAVKQPIDLNRAIESTATVSRNEWKYVAELKLDLDPDLPAVPCMAGGLNQVVLNLIVNAAHAIGEASGDSGRAKGTIEVSTRRLEKKAEIRISDTGTGIAPEIRARVFDPFFTTKDVGKGTGQGLSLAHTIVVEKHGGTITLESEVGRGTTFIVRLPLDRCAPALEEVA